VIKGVGGEPVSGESFKNPLTGGRFGRLEDGGEVLGGKPPVNRKKGVSPKHQR